MLRLVIGNKAYSSWSLRGWLACKLSGLPFEETVVPMFGEEWDRRRASGEFGPSPGKVPLLWDDDRVVWDSLAIVDYLADKVGRDVFWPADEGARAMARSMAAEMHSSFVALRRTYGMNTRRRFPAGPVPPDAAADIDRIVTLWAQARARFGDGGPFLFGQYSAADIMFAPVVTRFVTWALPVPRFAETYGLAVLTHPFMAEWLDAAADEPWVIDRLEQPIA